MINLKKIFNIFSRNEAEKLVRVSYDALLRRTVDKKSLNEHTNTLLDGMPPSSFLQLIASSEEFKNTTGYSICVDRNPNKSNLFEFKKTPSVKTQIKNLIYFVPSIKKEIGGIKVIIRHIEAINKLNAGIKGQLFFPDDTHTKLNWLDYSVPVKHNYDFDIKNDFIVIPEMWALQYSADFLKNNINYAIFVQNGYDVFVEIQDENEDKLNMLQRAYEGAAAVLTISDDTSYCISKTFPKLIDKIIQLTVHIDSNIFYIQEDKKDNIISFMPRKLSTHSLWIINQIKLLKNIDWKILPIIGFNEKSVGRIFRSSKIFLSFSDREGLSLPPLEAALSGNKVIGYTGEGSKEYWSGDIFTKIEAGNLNGFLDAVIKEMSNRSSDIAFSEFLKISSGEILQLQNRYSVDEEKLKLSKFVEFLRELR